MFLQQHPGPQIESSGVLPASGTIDIDVRGLCYPMTVSLASAVAGRRIELSNDSETWFDGVLDLTADDQLAIVLAGPLSAVRLTGAAGDKWGIT